MFLCALELLCEKFSMIKILGFKVLWIFLFYFVLGRMVDDGDDSGLRIVRSLTFIIDYKHPKDFGVKSGDGANGGNLVNNLAIERKVANVKIL